MPWRRAAHCGVPQVIVVAAAVAAAWCKQAPSVLLVLFARVRDQRWQLPRHNGAIVASEERLWLSVEGAVRRRRVVEALRDAHAAEGRHAWHPTLHRGTDSEFCLLFEALMPVDSASWTAGDDRLPARSVHNESCATTLAAIVSARRERAAAGSGTPQI